MRFEPGISREDVLAELTAEAERTWGSERLDGLAAALDSMATAVWRLAETPLDLLEDEPYFIRGQRVPGDQRGRS